MNSIRLDATELTPKVILDSESLEFEISGRSMPENPLKFYGTIQKWIEDYSLNPAPETIIKIKLEYCNSSSIGQLLKVLEKFKKILRTGKHVKVLWFYDKEDEVMEVKGIEMRDLVDIPFELKSISVQH